MSDEINARRNDALMNALTQFSAGGWEDMSEFTAKDAARLTSEALNSELDEVMRRELDDLLGNIRDKASLGFPYTYGRFIRPLVLASALARLGFGCEIRCGFLFIAWNPDGLAYLDEVRRGMHDTELLR